MPGEVEDYYHRILPFFEEELRVRGDEDFWVEQASGCRVLELGAGTGRATRWLAQQARSIVASELSPELLAQARRKLRGLHHVHLLAADMRELVFSARFDLVAAVDDPFVHLTRGADRDRAFAVVAEHLAPGGRFVLDSAWFPPGDRQRAAGRLVRERSVHDGRLQVREIWHCDPASRLCTVRFEYRQEDRLAAHASFRGRLWSLAELERRARTAGLRISHLWGEYDRRPWKRDSSPRLIVELTLARSRGRPAHSK